MKKHIGTALCAALVLVFALLALALVLTRERAVAENGVTEYGVDLACNRRVVASGNEADDVAATKAVDGNEGTRWASNLSDDAWMYVDLGSKEKFNKIVLRWEDSYASEYSLLVSNNAIEWYTVAEIQKTQKSVDTIEFPYYLEARFVKFQGVSRALKYGYSFNSLEVYGPRSLAAGASVTASSYENETELPAGAIVDDSASSRWASVQADNQRLDIDLGEEKTFDRIKIRWEISFARIYEIYADTNPITEENQGKKIYRTEAGLGEVDDIDLVSDYNVYNEQEPVTARYLRVSLIQREVSEDTKKSGRFPWQSTFSIYSLELFRWQEIPAIPVGSILEFSKDARAWGAMGNVKLYGGGLIMAPVGYPNVASDDKIDNGIMDGFESYAVYNPAVIYDDKAGLFRMVYRSELPDNFQNYGWSTDGKNKWGHVSTLSYAYSTDGVNYTRGTGNPIAYPTIAEEAGGGLEDPRIFRVKGNGPGGEDVYYVTYTMYDNYITREGMVYTTDFIHWTKVGRLAPEYEGAYKSGTFVTDPNGDAVMIEDPRPGKTGKVYIIYMKDGAYTKVGFTKNVTRIEKDDIVDVGQSGFSSRSIEAMTGGNESCMALTNIYGENDQNIYLMYGGGLREGVKYDPSRPNVTGGWFYALGVLKTTKSNPFELMNGELDIMEPFMYPTDTNKIDYGLFNKCMFADTMIRQGDKWYFYYGAGDMYVGLANANASLDVSAARFTKGDGKVTATAKAMNKKYSGDCTAEEVTLHWDVYRTDGVKITERCGEQAFTVEHFSVTGMGEYYDGKQISAEIAVPDEGEEFYIVVYATNSQGEVISEISSYVSLRGQLATENGNE